MVDIAGLAEKERERGAEFADRLLGVYYRLLDAIGMLLGAVELCRLGVLVG